MRCELKLETTGQGRERGKVRKRKGRTQPETTERGRREGLMFRKEMEELKLETTGQGRERGWLGKEI